MKIWSQLTLRASGRATDFCNANHFYWDGVISERVNLREWIYEQASYQPAGLHDEGGRFGL